jgi:acetolactate synthase-1/2/3 large subunit
MNTMRISDAMIMYLYNNGVRHAFGIPTAQIAGFSDGLNDYDIEYVVVKNEAAATYSAGRYADIRRDLGVCFLGGCVGVNNAINGIGDAYRNKLPLIIISSVVGKNMIGKNALQELETTNITQSITKYSKTIYDENEVMNELKKAIELALTPPYGPVHISIPSDIQMLPYTDPMPEIINRELLLPTFDDQALKKAIEVINRCETGIIMVGRGSRSLTKEIETLSNRLQWPIITTPNAKGIISNNFKYHLGNYGWCSTDGAMDYIDNTQVDCLLILGSSLGQMSTRYYNNALFKDRHIIHIDWDTSEFNKVFNAQVPVFYDLKKALPPLIQGVRKKSNFFPKPQAMNKPYVKNHTGLSLRLVLEKIPEIVPENTRFLQDMGENMNFSFKYLDIKENMDFQTSLHYASMGTAIAGVMGSYLADSSKFHAVIVGDGSFYMNGLEILTAKAYQMPIIYFVVNNAMLGLVEHGSHLNFGRSHKGHCSFDRISISKMCQSMDIDAVEITELNQLDALKEKLNTLSKPIVIELITDGSEVYMDTARWNKK